MESPPPDQSVFRPTMRDRGLLGNRYQVIRQIGEGAMAEVFLAHDELLQRDVAVKVLHRLYSADPQVVERFRREAQAAAGLSHPNVVGVYDWGSLEDTYYIVMEFVDGPNIKEVLREREFLPEDEALDIAGQVAAALGAAHAQGIIHRDIKPHNILLASNRRVKVADFGIARAAGAAQLTQTKAVLGTVHYVAPEHVQGRPVDGRTDLYSLGVVLFEMLTGRTPYDGESSVAVALQHVHSEPPPPRTIRPEISSAAEGLTLRALARLPEDRFQSAEEMGAAIERVRLGVARDGTAAMATVPGSAEDEQPTRAIPIPVGATQRVATSRSGVETRTSSNRRVSAGSFSGLLALAFVALLAVLTWVGGMALLGGGDEAAQSAPPNTMPSPSTEVAAAQVKPETTTVGAATAPIETVTATPAGGITAPTPSAISSAKPAAGPAFVPTSAPKPQAQSKQSQGKPEQPPGKPANSASDVQSPTQAVTLFYRHVHDGDFERASALWTPRMRQTFPPEEFIAGRFAETSQMIVRDASIVSLNERQGRAVVAVDLLEVTLDGTSRQYTGTWQVVRGENGWQLDRPDLVQS